MKIVVTDGYTLNPGDLSWEGVKDCGNVIVYDRTSPAQFMERCRDAEIILTNKTAIDKDAILACNQLKLISVLATGYNVVDTNAAREKGIAVCNVPAYGTASVAQHSFALLFELTNRVGLHSTSVANGDWQKSPDWCYSLSPIAELEGKTLGIIGFGNIGQRMARIAIAFGMQVIYNSPHDKKTPLGKYVDLQMLFSNSDVVTLHCPLKEENKEFVNRNLLSLMKPSSYIINTARGQLIHEQDLADALNNGIIAGAALDVLSTEPPNETNPLLFASNCIITPHNAWISREARSRIINVTRDNIKAFIRGELINQVN